MDGVNRVFTLVLMGKHGYNTLHADNTSDMFTNSQNIRICASSQHIQMLISQKTDELRESMTKVEMSKCTHK
jgi:hypothetical protein